MLKKRFNFSIVVLLFCLVSIANLGAKQATVLMSGGNSGIYSQFGEAIAQLVEKNMNFAIVNQSSQGSAENLFSLHNKATLADLAIAQSDMAYNAYHGNRPFKQKFTELRAVTNLYTEYIQIITWGNLGINKIEDLKDKKVAVGSRLSGNEINSRQILQYFGLDKSIIPIYVHYDKAVENFLQGKVDVLISTSGIPNHLTQKLLEHDNVKFLPIPEDDAKKISKKIPTFTPTMIPANSYKGQNEAISSLSVQALLVVHEDADADAVYTLNKLLYENASEIKASSDNIVFDPANISFDYSIPLHPGAEKYLREFKAKKGQE